MSTYFDPTPDPRQELRSNLGTPPGVPGPLGAPAPDAAPPLDFGAPPVGAQELPPLPPPPGPGDEVDLLKALVVGIHDYKALDISEMERVQIVQAEQIIQRLLAQNEKLADTAMGTSTANRKLLAR